MSRRLENAVCTPACIACRLAKNCLKAPPPDEWDDDNDDPNRIKRIRWTDELVGRELVCGHFVEAPPAIWGFGHIKDIKCFHKKCGGQWRELKKAPKKVKKDGNNGQTQLEKCPF